MNEIVCHVGNEVRVRTDKRIAGESENAEEHQDNPEDSDECFCHSDMIPPCIRMRGTLEESCA